MHSKVIHVNFFDFFLPYLQDYVFLRTRNFFSMTMWRDDFSLYLKRNERSVNRLWEDSLFSRLFTELYFYVRSSRSSALRYELPSCMNVKTT